MENRNYAYEYTWNKIEENRGWITHGIKQMAGGHCRKGK